MHSAQEIVPKEEIIVKGQGLQDSSQATNKTNSSNAPGQDNEDSNSTFAPVRSVSLQEMEKAIDTILAGLATTCATYGGRDELVRLLHDYLRYIKQCKERGKKQTSLHKVSKRIN